MPAFSWEVWSLIALIACAGVGAVLQTLARAAEHERRTHDLHVRVAELRSQYARRMADLQARGGGEIIEAIPVDDEDFVEAAA